MIGFFVLFGTKTNVRPIQAGAAPCPTCRAHGQMHLSESRRWFTVFFVPIIPLGAAEEFWQCGHCKGRFAVCSP